jgi:hypothetical protein
MLISLIVRNEKSPGAKPQGMMEMTEQQKLQIKTVTAFLALMIMKNASIKNCAGFFTCSTT